MCPRRRANISQICTHWWINKGYQQNCLNEAEVFAAQTPVRLDLLLSLESDHENSTKLIVRNEGSSTINKQNSQNMTLNSNTSYSLRRSFSVACLVKINLNSDLKVNKVNRSTKSLPSLFHNINYEKFKNTFVKKNSSIKVRKKGPFRNQEESDIGRHVNSVKYCYDILNKYFMFTTNLKKLSKLDFSENR